MDEEFDTTEEGLTSRAPRQKHLAALASEPNRLGTDYIVIGGFAIIISGYARSAMDLDLIVATDPENTAKVYKAPESPRLLYRMKEKTHREKDRTDLQFLRKNYAEEIFANGGRGQAPPSP